MAKTLHDVFLEALRDAYSAEQQWLAALPHVAGSTKSRELSSALRNHIADTNVQIDRLCDIFDALGEAAEGKVSLTMEALVTETQRLAQQGLDPAVQDAALVAAAHKIAHHEMACYAALCGYAEALGDESSARLMRASLEEQTKFDRNLSEIARNAVNPRATEGA